MRIRALRLLLAAAAALALLAALAGVWLWRERLRLAEDVVGRLAARAGLAGVSLRVAEVGVGSARLEALRVGEPPDLEVRAVALEYSLAGLAHGRVRALHVDGARLRGRVGADGVSFGALDALVAGGAVGAAPGAFAPPAERVELRDALVELATPAGPVALAVSGEAALEPAAATAQLALEAKAEAGEAALQLELRAANDGWSASWKDGTARVAVPTLGNVALGPLRGSAAGPRGRPAALELHVGLAGGRSELAGRGTLALAPLRLALDLGGTLELVPDRLALADLAPGLARFARRAQGSLRVDARLALDGDDLAWTAGAGSEALDLETADGSAVERLSGRAELAGPAPLHTTGSQTLRFGRADVLGPFEDGEVRWQLRGGALEVEEAHWRYAGGSLSTSGRFPLDAPRWPFTVSVSQLPLERLLAELAVPDLSGTGLLSGELPLVYDGQAFHVESGVLRAAPPGGVIRYAPSASAAAGLGLGGDVEVLVGALEELHYTKLELALDGALSGDVQARLAIDGRNPRYERGRPVELRVKVDTNLPALLRGGRSITGVPEVIERRLRDRVPVGDD